MDPITQYLELARRRPELFVPSEHFPLFLDEVTLRRYAAATGRPVGVVYDNSPYYLVLADLCLDAGGPYTYARVIYPHHSSGAVVIPRRGDRFGLLSIFRHPTRSESGGEFPRGFSEGHSPAETAARELEEELGARVDPDDLEYLGDVQPDTGLSSGRVQVFLARVDQADWDDLEDEEDWDRALREALPSLRRLGAMVLLSPLIWNGVSLSVYCLEWWTGSLSGAAHLFLTWLLTAAWGLLLLALDARRR